MAHRASSMFQKAQEFTETTYSGSLSMMAFLERALENIPQGTALGENTAGLLMRAQQVNRELAALRHDLSRLAEATSSQE